MFDQIMPTGAPCAIDVTSRVIERVEGFMCNTTIHSASVLVFCFSRAAYAAGKEFRANYRTKIKKRCTDESITQEASAFG
jgi:hypothetical protein